jgi:hypothetical protein
MMSDAVTKAVEAAAKAACKECGQNPDATNAEGDFSEPGLSRSWPMWAEFDPLARVTILAFLDAVKDAPTEEMLVQGMNTLGFMGVPISREAAAHCWTKMSSALRRGVAGDTMRTDQQGEKP